MRPGSHPSPGQLASDQHILEPTSESGPLLQDITLIDVGQCEVDGDDDDGIVRELSSLSYRNLLPRISSSVFLGPLLTPISSGLRPNRRSRSQSNPLSSTFAKALLPQASFLLAWFILNLVLVHRSWFISSLTQADHFPQPTQPEWLECVASSWSKDDGCGLNGEKCREQIRNLTLPFRCPSRCGTGTGLLNPRVVGARILNYQPLVVGGGGDRKAYRPDSFICQSAVHAGIISSRWGGCGVLRMWDETSHFEPIMANGINSIGFPVPFPASFSFLEDVQQLGCHDLWIPIILVNVSFSSLFALFLSPSPQTFFWILCVVGYVTVVVASEPGALPPSLSIAARDFLPFLFVCYWLWKVAWSKVIPSISASERIWVYILPWWLGLILNLTFGWVPIDRLTPHDIQQRPGGILALSILIILTATLTSYQVWCLNKANRLTILLVPYAMLVIVLVTLSLIPEHSVRLHHYITGIILSPLTSVATKSSGILQAFFLGIIQNGLGRWSFGSIIESSKEVIGDAYNSQDKMPEFDPMNSGLVNGLKDLNISWKSLNASMDPTDRISIGLMINDILRFIIASTDTSIIIHNLLRNVSVPNTTDSTMSIPNRTHGEVDRFFFRLALFHSKRSSHHHQRFDRLSEFTGPITFFVNNQT